MASGDPKVDLLFIQPGDAQVQSFLQRRNDIVDLHRGDGPATLVCGIRAESGVLSVVPGMWVPGYALFSPRRVTVMKSNVVTDTSRQRSSSLNFTVDHERHDGLRAELTRRGATLELSVGCDESLFELIFFPPPELLDVERREESTEAVLGEAENFLAAWCSSADIPVQGLGVLPTMTEAAADRARTVLSATSDKITLSDFREATTETMGKIVEVLAVHEAEISRLQQENEKLAAQLRRLGGEEAQS